MKKPDLWQESVIWAYLLDDMSPPDKATFETLLAQSPELRLEVAKERLLMEILGNLPVAADLAHETPPPALPVQEATRYPVKAMLKDGFLVCLLVAIVYLFIAYIFF